MRIGVEYSGEEVLELIWRDLKEKFPGRVGGMDALTVVGVPLGEVSLKVTLAKEGPSNGVGQAPQPAPDPLPVPFPPPPYAMEGVPGVDFSLDGDPRDVIVDLPPPPMDHSLQPFDIARDQRGSGINAWRRP